MSCHSTDTEVVATLNLPALRFSFAGEMKFSKSGQRRIFSSGGILLFKCLARLSGKCGWVGGSVRDVISSQPRGE